MNQKEIEEYLDIHMTEVVKNLKTKAEGVDQVTLSGAISGFLLKTGLKLAAHDGCPKQVMKAAMAAAIEEAYKR